MKKYYYVRGKRVELEEVENVLGVKLPKSAGRTGEEQLKDTARPATFKTDKAVRDAFQQAGWHFVHATDALREAERNHRKLPGTDAVAKVYRDQYGRLMVGTNRLSVKLPPKLSEAEAEKAIRAAGLTVDRKLGFAPNLYDVTIGPGMDSIDTARELHEGGNFVYAEPQLIQHIPGRFVPADPDYGDQWQWNNDGSGGGTAGADVHAQEAWDTTRGSGVRVAVVDNGMQVTHPDLSGAIVAEAAFFSDDGSGGADFNQTLAGFPDGDHGTFCSGQAVARVNNATNGCGLASQAGFIPVACLVDQIGTQATLARAIAYAADPSTEVGGADPSLGADVISCSLGPNGTHWTLESVLDDAINAATTNGRGGKGTAIFWATDNSTIDLAEDEVCSHANVIAVGRSTRTDTDDGSAHGPKLDFLAPGVDVASTHNGDGFGTSTGTSFAAPAAAGCGALVVAVNPDLTRTELRQIMRDTCDKVGGVVYDGSGHNDNFGFGRINAAQAICTAAYNVTLETPSLNFNDVPEGQTTVRAVVFQVVSCAARTFQIVSGPTKLTGPAATTFGTPLGATTPLSATTDLSVPREARLWVSFTGTAAGDNATGTLTVQLNETSEQWIIPITTHTIARPRALVGMVLDQSGSMDWDAGDGRTRMQVLHDAAAPFIDVMYENDALAVVGFDEDAHDEMGITVMGPATPFDAGRVAARAAIAAHHTNPAGATSIGDGIERAHQIVNPEAGYDVKALVVLTDGQENTPAFIADVAGDINQYVFAIGLGTTQEVNPVALNAIANGSGGYLLMTGTLGTDDFFRLSKYYQQILAGVTNTDIVLDPEGYISTGQRQKIPFRLTEADIQSDVVLLTPTPWLVQFSLETPDGTVITPADAGVTPGMNYYQSNNVSYYRMTLPVPVGAHGAKAGQWHAVLETSRRLPGGTVEGSGGQKYTVHYSLSVRSFSNLRMRGRLLQNSNEPGATMTLRAVLTEYDLPVEDRAKVRAQLERPDGTKATLVLKEVEPGVFETHMIAAIPGIYSFRLMASGKTLRGQPFTREQLLTGAVWRGGDQNPPTGGGPGGPGKDKPCCLLNCLTSPKVLTPRFEELAKQWGINLEGLRACHKSCCSK